MAVPATARWTRNRARLVWIAVSALLLVSTIAFAYLYFRRPLAQTPAATRFLIYPPEKAYYGGSFAVSPDGRRVVSRINFEGKVLLWVRALDSLTAQPLAGTEDSSFPFWSPDSRFIGFFSEGKLKKIEVTGGPAQTLCDAPDARGGTWNADGVIVFAPKGADVLYRVAAAGGTPVPLTTLDTSRKEISHYHPRFLPDGRHFLYLANSPQRESAGIYVGSLDKQVTKLLVNTDASAAYAPPGYLLFLHDRTLMAQGFDADKLELRGEAFSVAEQVDRLGGGARFALFSVSDTGVLTYRTGFSDSSQLIWFDRDGKPLGTVGPTGGYNSPWLSPDEKRVAFGRQEPPSGGLDIWLVEMARGTLLASPSIRPAIKLRSGRPTAAASSLVRIAKAPRTFTKRRRAARATTKRFLNLTTRKFPTTGPRTEGSFSIKTGTDLWVLPLSGEQKPFPFLQTEFTEGWARFSPDGKWIAYSSNESGTWQVYVQSFPASGGKWMISTDGGAQPQWRRDGKELFYISSNRKLMAVDVKGNGSTFEAGVPKALFDLRLQTPALPGPRNFYIAAANGQRFLVVSASEERISTPTTVVLNWTSDLKR